MLGLKESMRVLDEKLSVNPKLKHLRLKLKQSTASRASPEERIDRITVCPFMFRLV